MRTSIHIFDFQIEREIEKDQESSLFLKFMDPIQFNGIFHLHFFPTNNV